MQHLERQFRRSVACTQIIGIETKLRQGKGNQTIKWGSGAQDQDLPCFPLFAKLDLWLEKLFIP